MGAQDVSRKDEVTINVDQKQRVIKVVINWYDHTNSEHICTWYTPKLKGVQIKKMKNAST